MPAQSQDTVHTTPYPCDCADRCQSSVEIPLDVVAVIAAKDFLVVIRGHRIPSNLTLVKAVPPKNTFVIALPGQRLPTDSEITTETQGYGIYTSTA